MSVQDHIRNETKKNFVINVALNAAIAYATLRGLSEVRTWGEHGYGKDLIITGFLLSAILSGIFIGLFRRKRNKGDVVPAGTEGQALAWLLPYNPWIAAPWIGILGATLSVPPLLVILALLDISTLSPLSYAVIKGIWAGVLAAIIVPIAILQGLRTAPDQLSAV